MAIAYVSKNNVVANALESGAIRESRQLLLTFLEK